MKQLYLQGLYNEVAGRRDQMLADMSVLLERPAGLADHGNISDEIRGRLEELDKYDSLISTFEKYFRPREDAVSPEPPASPPTPSNPASLPTKVLDEGEK